MIQPASNDWIQQTFVREFGNKMLPTDFYYNEDGYRVMTESYHVRRGTCCGNDCLHCPYTLKHELNNTKLNNIY